MDDLLGLPIYYGGGSHGAVRKVFKLNIGDGPKKNVKLLKAWGQLHDRYGVSFIKFKEGIKRLPDGTLVCIVEVEDEEEPPYWNNWSTFCWEEYTLECSE